MHLFIALSNLFLTRCYTLGLTKSNHLCFFRSRLCSAGHCSIGDSKEPRKKLFQQSLVFGLKPQRSNDNWFSLPSWLPHCSLFPQFASVTLRAAALNADGRQENGISTEVTST